MRVRKPARLRKGDLLGIIAPASPVADLHLVERGVRYLERCGYRALVGSSVFKTHGYLSGTDRQRMDDLHAMFRDRRVKGIICVRGGYGTPRLLPMIDYRLIARNPKVLVGFSDVTALQLAIWKKCRLVTFHGPMLAGDMAARMHPFTEEMFWRILTSTRPLGRVNFPASIRPWMLHTGRASGRLLGGNLSLICTLLGTRFRPDFRGSILFLEETGEEPYRVDRMLTQLSNASILSGVAGIVAGSFTNCVPSDPVKPSFTVDHLLHELALTGKPFLGGVPFGHTPVKLTLPVGITARLDTARTALMLDESAVV